MPQAIERQRLVSIILLFREKPRNWCLSLTPVFLLSERSTCGYFMWRVPYFLIRMYQAVLSPLIPPTCRFQPSCSHYGAEALKVHGFWRGSWLTTRRVCRCHPWHPGGYDPVPIVKQSPNKSTEASSSDLNTSADGDTAHG